MKSSGGTHINYCLHHRRCSSILHLQVAGWEIGNNSTKKHRDGTPGVFVCNFSTHINLAFRYYHYIVFPWKCQIYGLSLFYVKRWKKYIDNITDIIGPYRGVLVNLQWYAGEGIALLDGCQVFNGAAVVNPLQAFNRLRNKGYNCQLFFNLGWSVV